MWKRAFQWSQLTRKSSSLRSLQTECVHPRRKYKGGRKHKRRSLLCDIRLWHILERGGRLEREKEWEVISPAGRHPRETDLTHTGQKTSVERWSISLPQWKVERKFSQKNKMFREIFLWHGNESVRNKGGIASFCLRTPPKNLGVGDNWIGNVIKWLKRIDRKPVIGCGGL